MVAIQIYIGVSPDTPPPPPRPPFFFYLLLFLVIISKQHSSASQAIIERQEPFQASTWSGRQQKDNWLYWSGQALASRGRLLGPFTELPFSSARAKRSGRAGAGGGVSVRGAYRRE